MIYEEAGNTQSKMFKDDLDCIPESFQNWPKWP